MSFAPSSACRRAAPASRNRRASSFELLLGAAQDRRGSLSLRLGREGGERVGCRGELLEGQALFAQQALAALVVLPQQVKLPLAPLEVLAAAQGRLDLALLGLGGQRRPQLPVPALEALLLQLEGALRPLRLELPLGVLGELDRELVDLFVRPFQLRLVGADLAFQSLHGGGGVADLFFATLDFGFQLAEVGRLPAQSLQDQLLLARVDVGEFDRFAQMPDPKQALQLVFSFSRVFGRERLHLFLGRVEGAAKHLLGEAEAHRHLARGPAQGLGQGLFLGHVDEVGVLAVDSRNAEEAATHFEFQRHRAFLPRDTLTGDALGPGAPAAAVERPLDGGEDRALARPVRSRDREDPGGVQVEVELGERAEIRRLEPQQPHAPMSSAARVM